MYSKSQSGFSLVETLVAISLLLIIIVGPMTISSSAARSTSFASEQVIAFFLAQEGAEIAQKARDDLILEYGLTSSDGWDEFVDDSSGALYEECFTNSGCGLELNTDATGSINAPEDCSTGDRCRLYFDDTNGRAQYTYESSGTTQTEFTRRITMEEIAGREVRVRSIVTWRTGSQIEDQEIFVETYLFNVYGN